MNAQKIQDELRNKLTSLNYSVTSILTSPLRPNTTTINVDSKDYLGLQKLIVAFPELGIAGISNPKGEISLISFGEDNRNIVSPIADYLQTHAQFPPYVVLRCGVENKTIEIVVGPKDKVSK